MSIPQAILRFALAWVLLLALLPPLFALGRWSSRRRSGRPHRGPRLTADAITGEPTLEEGNHNRGIAPAARMRGFSE